MLNKQPDLAAREKAFGVIRLGYDEVLSDNL